MKPKGPSLAFGQAMLGAGPELVKRTKLALHHLYTPFNPSVSYSSTRPVLILPKCNHPGGHCSHQIGHVPNSPPNREQGWKEWYRTTLLVLCHLWLLLHWGSAQSLVKGTIRSFCTNLTGPEFGPKYLIPRTVQMELMPLSHTPI